MESPQPPAVTIHCSELGTWERARAPAGGRLRGMVTGYTGFRQRVAARGPHRGMPGPVLPLVLSFGPPQTIVTPHTGRPAVTVGSFVSGPHDRHVLIEADAHHGIQVDLDPVVAYRLLRVPLRELAGQVVPLDALLGAEAARLLDDLATAPGWQARFARLERYLAGRLDAGRAPAPEVVRSWALIARSRGRVRVTDLAADVGWTQRHLTGRFGAQLGLTPKRVARLTRFAHAAALLVAPHPGGLARLAAHAGYCDQAHLAGEIRAFTGLSPTELLARSLPDGGGVYDPVPFRPRPPARGGVPSGGDTDDPRRKPR